MTNYTALEILPPVAGDAIITIYEMSGKQIAQIQSYLENIRQDFKLSCVENGLYLVNINGNGYQFSEKLISNRKSKSGIRIEKVNSNIHEGVEKLTNKDFIGTHATVDMAYFSGDRLKFTGISDNYSTVKMDVPTVDKTITFNFIPCIDGDNNNYTVVEIGSQVWMAENLKTTKFSDGTEIPLITDNDWFYLSTPGFGWYNNDIANKVIYVALYNWFTVADNRNLCPIGWLVSSEAEWTILTTFLGGENVAGGKLKETGTTHWQDALYIGITNETVFKALPGGYRLLSGGFDLVRFEGYWWSSTEYDELAAWSHSIDFEGINVYKTPLDRKMYGYSVRCLKN